MMRVTAITIATVVLACMSPSFAGETWPDRTVKFIVPFGPGAGADIGARLFADRLSTPQANALCLRFHLQTARK